MAERAFKAAFNNSAVKGKLTSDCIKKWFTKAGIIGKQTGITETDFEAAVSKVSKDEKGLDLAELEACINILEKKKKIEPKMLLKKLVMAGEDCCRVDDDGCKDKQEK